MSKNTIKTHNGVTKLIHWAMAVIFIGMFVVAYIMINIPRSDFRYSLYDLHKATGLLLFGLVAFRLIWRSLNQFPALPQTIPMWQQRTAQGNIIFLYLLMFVMPLSGFLTSTLGGHDITFFKIFTISPFAYDKSASEFFSEAHEIFSYLLMIAFSLHVLGAFYHHYFLKDDVLRRMWRKKQ